MLSKENAGIFLPSFLVLDPSLSWQVIVFIGTCIHCGMLTQGIRPRPYALCHFKTSNNGFNVMFDNVLDKKKLRTTYTDVAGMFATLIGATDTYAQCYQLVRNPLSTPGTIVNTRFADLSYNLQSGHCALWSTHFCIQPFLWITASKRLVPGLHLQIEQIGLTLPLLSTSSRLRALINSHRDKGDVFNILLETPFIQYADIFPTERCHCAVS